MPTFYIGSTSVKRIEIGYCGSVKSKRWSKIWKSELKLSKHLFEVQILSLHETRSEALDNEYKIQKKWDIVQNDNFINEAYACSNGFFGRDVSGQKNPMYGKTHTNSSKLKMSQNHWDCSGPRNFFWRKNFSTAGRKHTEHARLKMSQNHWNCSGEQNPMYGLRGSEHPAFGYRHSKEIKQKLKKPKSKVQCPHCGKEGGKPAMVRYHFEKCKFKSGLDCIFIKEDTASGNELSIQ